jgi:hypothetical protein
MFFGLSLDPPVAAASSAAGSPAVEKGDWRGNNHSPKPSLHINLYLINPSAVGEADF